MDYLDIHSMTRARTPEARDLHARLLADAASAVRECGSEGADVNEGVGTCVRRFDGRLFDVSISGERRVELEVAAGERALLYVLSGYGRLEGDDTAIAQDDVVWFGCADHGDIIGLEADAPLRALVFTGHAIDGPALASREAAAPGGAEAAERPTPGEAAPPL